MRHILLIAGFSVLVGAPATAEQPLAVFAKRTVRVGAVVTAQDVELRQLPEHRAAGLAQSLDDVVGHEVRRNLYASRPVMTDDVGAPTLVHRNSLITLVYTSGNLELIAVGRAMDSAGLYEPLRAVNVDSRATVIGTVTGPGTVRVRGSMLQSGAAQ
jgi:flagella basal body P-ring formation protein FlgA